MLSVSTLVVVAALLAAVLSDGPILRAEPQQIHISYWTEPNEMMLTWSQINQTREAIVRYGLDERMNTVSKGESVRFTDGGSERRTQYISRVLLINLIPGKKYWYVVGNEHEWSDVHSFKAMQAGQDWSPRLAVFGDMGNENAQSLARLEMEAFTGQFDAVLHVGDFAYDMNEHQGETGNEFMRQLEPLASRVPYMTAVGNHENAYNFAHYRNRFNMPKDDGKMYYSFNMGPVHFVSVSTEFPFYWHYNPMQIYWQYEWLLQDLKEANKEENRSKRPWIVVFGHRPMYCSGNDTDDCTKRNSIIRTGLPHIHIFGFEDVLYDYGVDLAIWAHEHEYERLWPVYDWKVMNGSYNEPYTEPRAPVNIITGSAGCRERKTGFHNNTAPWSAYRSSDYGYSHVLVHNKTHLTVEQISDDKNGAIVDRITIIKTKHRPYSHVKRAKQFPYLYTRKGFSQAGPAIRNDIENKIKMYLKAKLQDYGGKQ